MAPDPALVAPLDSGESTFSINASVPQSLRRSVDSLRRLSANQTVGAASLTEVAQPQSAAHLPTFVQTRHRNAHAGDRRDSRGDRALAWPRKLEHHPSVCGS